ncbi:hypothetical protein, partial [Acerihabitans sp.]|uniref:hypothetical protein n=1 Tax=Acerihabitans sp. TaxID=2811394 RepID=UPI002ED90E79
AGIECAGRAHRGWMSRRERRKSGCAWSASRAVLKPGCGDAGDRAAAHDLPDARESRGTVRLRFLWSIACARQYI